MNSSIPRALSFDAPQWLGLAVAGPLAILALQWAGRRRQRTALHAFLASIHHARLVRAPGGRWELPKRLFQMLAVMVVGLSLARPRWGNEAAPTAAGPTGPDAVFVVDCSRSMLVEDVVGTRLGAVRAAMRDLIGTVPLGRVGLVAFAGQAFALCPPTLDHDAFQQAVLSLDGGSIPVAGSNLGGALTEAALVLKDAPGRRLLVLVSDGEDLEATGLARARELQAQGIRVCTVGIGTAAGGVVPREPDLAAAAIGGGKAPVRSGAGESGEPAVISHLDEARLRTMAESTGGVYRRWGEGGEGLREVLRIETERRDPGTAGVAMVQGVERYQIPATAALVLWAVEYLIPANGRRRVVRGGSE